MPSNPGGTSQIGNLWAPQGGTQGTQGVCSIRCSFPDDMDGDARACVDELHRPRPHLGIFFDSFYDDEGVVAVTI